MSFDALRRDADDRRESARRTAQEDMIFRRRLDPVLLSVVIGFVIACILLGLAFAEAQTRWGWFDPAPIAPIADERLVDNIRSEEAVANGPIVAAAHLPGIDRVEVLRRDGLLHSYDTTTRLWSDDDSLSKGQSGITSSFVGLSQACTGHDETIDDSCVDDDGVFATSDLGGLVMRQDGRWRTVLSDTRFIGVSGKRVAQEDVISVAVSGDRRWLLVATRSEGLGLFDLVSRIWHPIEKEMQANLLGGETLPPPTALGASDRRFLIGTSNGLATLTVSTGGDLTAGSRAPQPNGAILDIASDGEETLVLASNGCDGGDCLGLYRLEDEALVRIMGEDQVFPQLSSASVSRGFLSPDETAIFVLGDAGIYRYDRQARNWSRLSIEAASVFLEAPDVDGIIFASPGHVGSLSSNGRLQLWPLEGETVVSLAKAENERIWVQTASNKTYAWGGEVAPVLAVEGAPAREDLSGMKRAVFAFDRIIMVGAQELVIHDPFDRTYHSIQKAGLEPSQLFDPDVRLLGTQRILWAVGRVAVEAYEMNAGGDAPSLKRLGVQALAGTSLRSVRLDGDDLQIIDWTGVPVRFAVNGSGITRSDILGPALSDRRPVVDALRGAGTVLLAQGDAVSVYSERARGFQEPIGMPIEEGIREMTFAGNTLTLLGEEGNIVVPGSDATLTGAGDRLLAASEAITDAVREGDFLFLASRNGVDIYSTRTRRIIETFPFQARGDLHLAGIADGVPVTFDGEGAWLGSQTLAIAGADVLSASLNNSSITSVQRDGRGIFLVRQDANTGSRAQPTCYFSNPGPENAGVLDAIALPDGRIAALAGDTLWVRDRDHRRFVGFRIAAGSFTPTTRLTLLSGSLVAHDGTGAWAVPLEALAFNDSCSNEPVDLRGRTATLAGLAVAVSAARNDIWTLQANGRVDVWSNGETRTVRLPDGASTPSAFQSADLVDDALVFADPKRLWTYDSRARLWSSRPFADDGPIAHADIWNDGSDLMATLEQADGSFLGGSVGSDDETIRLSRLTQGRSAELPFSPLALQDVSQLGTDQWLFLGGRDIAVIEDADGTSPRLSGAFTFSENRDDRTVWLQNRNAVIIAGDPDRPERVSVLAQNAGTSSGAKGQLGLASFVPEDGETYIALSSGNLLRQFENGRVEECSIEAVGGDDVDVSSGCTELAGPALVLDRDAVTEAYALTSTVWLLHMSDGSLSLIDRPRRHQRLVSRDMAPIEKVIWFERSVYILDRERRLLSLDLEAAALTEVAEDVRAIRRGPVALLVQTGTGLERLVGSTTTVDPIEILEDMRGAAPSGDVNTLSLWGDGLAGIVRDESGTRLLSLQNDGAMRLDDILTLPGAASIPGPILQAGPLKGDRWRLRLADEILEIARGTCRKAEEPPEARAPTDATEGTEKTGRLASETPVAEVLPNADPTDENSTRESATAKTSKARQALACLIVERRIQLPASNDDAPLVMGLAEGGGLLIDGRLVEPGDCEAFDRDYAETPPLTGRPATSACTLDPSDFLTAPSVSIEAITLQERGSELVGAIETASNHLDPTRIEEGDGRLDLMVGAFKLTDFRGSTRRQLAEPAKARSFSWNREDAAFVFRNHDGRSFAVSPADAMPDGRFAFAAPGEAVMIDRDSYLVANRYGTWIYDLENTRGPTWQRVSLPAQSARSARGRIIYDDGRSIGAADAMLKTVDPRVRLSLGKLTVQSDPLAADVSALWSDGLTTHSAFSQTGFLFDERSDLAATAEGIWISTPIGLIDVRDFGRSAPLPPFEPERLVNWRDDAYAVDRSGRWFQFGAQNWRPVADPLADREAARDGSLIWAFQDGTLTTTSMVAGESERRGLRFDSDVLIDAVDGDGTLLIRLADGLRAVSGVDALSDVKPATHPGLSTARMEVRPLASGTMAIVAVASDGRIVSRWTGSDFVPLAATDDPDIERRAAVFEWLRVRFQQNTPVVEISLEDTGGNRTWSTLDWSRGASMPFDRFTAIHGIDGALYAGTSVGLQILTVDGTDILSQRFIDLRSRAGAFDSVRRIGKPVQNDRDIFVLGDRECLRISSGTLTRCDDLRALDREDLGTDAFWRWERDDGRVGFVYLDQNGAPLGGLTSMPGGGRFPHDALDDLAHCNGLFQTWDGNVTSLAGAGLASARTIPVKPGNSLQLVCRSTSIPPSADAPEGLPGGLYLSDGDETFVWSGGSVLARNTLTSALAARKDGGMPFEAAKLRLRNLSGGRGVEYQYRRGDEWRRLLTAGGRLAIDDRGGLVRAEGEIWAYTPQGFVKIDERSGGLDPDSVLLAPVVPESEPACRFDTAETADGLASFIDVPPDEATTFLRCNDGRLFDGRLDAASETRSFDPVAPSDDPFVERLIHEDDVLRLARTGRVAGRSGSLDFGWRGEPNPLSGGRLALDHVQGIARVEDGILDMVTGLGWVRQNGSDFADRAARRPVNRAEFAQSVTALARDVDHDRLSDLESADRVSLCLTASDGNTVRWFTDGEFRAQAGCAGLLGFDGSYAYRETRDGVTATARGLDGTTTSRILVDGRFSDNEMFGEAVIARYDGRAVIAIASLQKIVMFDAASLELLGAWSWPETPVTLYLSPAGRIVVASGEKTRWLENGEAVGCAGLSNLEQSAGVTILGVDRTDGRMHARLLLDGSPEDFVFSCDDRQIAFAGDFAPTAERDRYLSNFVRWGTPDPVVEIFLGATGDVATRFGNEQKEQATLSSPWLFNRFVEDRFILVNPDDVLAADVDAIMSDMMREKPN